MKQVTMKQTIYYTFEVNDKLLKEMKEIGIETENLSEEEFKEVVEDYLYEYFNEIPLSIKILSYDGGNTDFYWYTN